MIRRIASRDADYQRFEVLKTNRNKRFRYGAFLVEGVRNINEAIRYAWQFVSLIYTREKPLSRWAEEILSKVKTECNYELTAELMGELSGKEDTSELLAVIRMRPDDPAALIKASRPMLALFDRPSNRGNLGTLIRSCDALGINGLILTGHGVDPYDTDVVTAGMGSFFRVPLMRMPENNTVRAFIADMKTRFPGFHTLGTTAHADTALWDADFVSPFLLMIGNETDGLARELKEMCDALIAIPMDALSAASSLNVSCAATVFFAEAARQRRG